MKRRMLRTFVSTVGLMPALCLVASVTAAPLRPVPPGLEAVPGNAWYVATLRLGAVYQSDSARTFRTALEQSPKWAGEIAAGLGVAGLDQIERVTCFCVGERWRPVVLCTCKEPFDRNKVLAAHAPGATERSIAGVPSYRHEESWSAVAFLDNRTFLRGELDAVEEYLERPRVPAGPLMSVLRQASEHDFVGWSGRETMQRLRQFLPESLALLADLPAPKSVTVHGSFRAGLRLTLRAEFPTAEVVARTRQTPANLREWMLRKVSPLKQQYVDAPGADRQPLRRSIAQFVRAAEDALGSARVQDDGVELCATAEVHSPEPATALLSLVFCSRSRVVLFPWFPDENLATTAQALRRFDARRGRLPDAALCSNDGKPLLSWRVQILPFLGEEELYKEFHMDEPWDSPANRRLARRMPAVFVDKGSPYPEDTPTTSFQVFIGKGTLFQDGKGANLKALRGDPAGVFLVAQSRRPVPWTKPEDLCLSPNGPLPELGSRMRPSNFGEFQAAFADARVKVLHTGEINKEVWGLLPTPDLAQRRKAIRRLITGTATKADCEVLARQPQSRFAEAIFGGVEQMHYQLDEAK